MIDIHCHILPNMDDGARNLSEALAMARMAAESGVTDIVATPHFRGEHRSLNDLEVLLARFRQLQGLLREEGLPLTLYPGAEILCLPQTLDMARSRQLPTLGDSSYVLCEFYFDESVSFMDELLSGIAANGYIPVVAHPERYHAVQHDPRCMERWFGEGWVIQLNKGSIQGAFGYEAQNTAQWILNGGLAHVVASDAHGVNRRTPELWNLRQQLIEKLPAAYVKILLDINPARLIRGEPMYRS